MTESVEVQMARHDEQIKALREELKDGFDRMVTAFEKHQAEDDVAHVKLDNLAIMASSQAAANDASAKTSRKFWGAITTLSAAVGAGVSGLIHYGPAIAQAILSVK